MNQQLFRVLYSFRVNKLPSNDIYVRIDCRELECWSWSTLRMSTWKKKICGCLSQKRPKNKVMTFLGFSSLFFSFPWSLAHISWVVPRKPHVTQNKLPSLWMGQNNTEMSLFHCNWSYLGKHKSIVSIIAMSSDPQRFFHKGSFACFSLSHWSCLIFATFEKET